MRSGKYDGDDDGFGNRVAYFADNDCPPLLLRDGALPPLVSSNEWSEWRITSTFGCGRYRLCDVDERQRYTDIRDRACNGYLQILVTTELPSEEGWPVYYLEWQCDYIVPPRT